MKTKEKEIQKKLKELCELMDENEKFFFFRKKGNVVDIALPNASEENDNRVSAALSSVIEALIGMSPLAGTKLASRFAKASLLGMKMTLDKIKDFDEDDEDDAEDCENCEFLKTCENESAIKYRKEHGIPKPKKNRKGGRKVETN